MTVERGRRTAGRAAALLVATVGLGVGGSPVAGAAGTGSTLAGRYTAMILVTKKVGTSGPEGLVLKAGGHFVLAGKNAPRGTWAENGDVLTLTGTGRTGGGLVFTATVSGTDLGSKAQPGDITLDGKHFAHWYAVPQ